MIRIHRTATANRSAEKRRLAAAARRSERQAQADAWAMAECNADARLEG